MRLVAVAEPHGQIRPVHVASQPDLFRGLVQPVPADQRLGADADVVGEPALHLPDAQPRPGRERVHPDERGLGRGPLGNGGGRLGRLRAGRHDRRQEPIGQARHVLARGHVLQAAAQFGGRRAEQLGQRDDPVGDRRGRPRNGRKRRPEHDAQRPAGLVQRAGVDLRLHPVDERLPVREHDVDRRMRQHLLGVGRAAAQIPAGQPVAVHEPGHRRGRGIPVKPEVRQPGLRRNDPAGVLLHRPYHPGHGSRPGRSPRVSNTCSADWLLIGNRCRRATVSSAHPS